jgi:hypothetical protein
VPGSEYRIVVGRWGNHCKFYIAPMKLLTCAIVYMNRSRYLLHDPWSVKCLIARRVQKEGDWYYSTLVQCEGSDCTCGKMVHPVCAVTTLVMAHAYCCRFVLHDHNARNRLYLCDSCASTVLCKKHIAWRPMETTCNETKVSLV